MISYTSPRVVWYSVADKIHGLTRLCRLSKSYSVHVNVSRGMGCPPSLVLPYQPHELYNCCHQKTVLSRVRILQFLFLPSYWTTFNAYRSLKLPLDIWTPLKRSRWCDTFPAWVNWLVVGSAIVSCTVTRISSWPCSSIPVWPTGTRLPVVVW